MAKGIYSLIIKVRRCLTLNVGALGLRAFKPGLYVYVGSALGSGGQSLEGRISRHLSGSKRARWHIDYLLLNSSTKIETVVVSETIKRAECPLVRELAKVGLLDEKLRGFGSSDCRSGCFSHLIYFNRVAVETVLNRVLEAYRRLGLRAKPLKPEDLRKNRW